MDFSEISRTVSFASNTSAHWFLLDRSSVSGAPESIVFVQIA